MRAVPLLLRTLSGLWRPFRKLSPILRPAGAIDEKSSTRTAAFCTPRRAILVGPAARRASPRLDHPPPTIDIIALFAASGGCELEYTRIRNQQRNQRDRDDPASLTRASPSAGNGFC